MGMTCLREDLFVCFFPDKVFDGSKRKGSLETKEKKKLLNATR